MDQEERKTFTFSDGAESGSSKLTPGSPQQEDLNVDGNESLYQNEEGQSSISEKQTTAGEKQRRNLLCSLRQSGLDELYRSGLHVVRQLPVIAFQGPSNLFNPPQSKEHHVRPPSQQYSWSPKTTANLLYPSHEMSGSGSLFTTDPRTALWRPYPGKTSIPISDSLTLPSSPPFPSDKHTDEELDKILKLNKELYKTCIELLHTDKDSQTSISDKKTTIDETISAVAVGEELPSKKMSYFILSGRDCENWPKNRTQPPSVPAPLIPQEGSRLQRGELSNSLKSLYLNKPFPLLLDRGTHSAKFTLYDLVSQSSETSDRCVGSSSWPSSGSSFTSSPAEKMDGYGLPVLEADRHTPKVKRRRKSFLADENQLQPTSDPFCGNSGVFSYSSTSSLYSPGVPKPVTNTDPKDPFSEGWGNYEYSSLPYSHLPDYPLVHPPLPVIHDTDWILAGLHSIPSACGSVPRSHSSPSLSEITSAENKTQATSLPVHSHLQPDFFCSGGDSDALVELDAALTAVKCSVTNTLPTHSQICSSGSGWSKEGSVCFPRSHSSPSLSQITSAENKTQASSLPDLLLNTSCEQFTPEITADEDEEAYSFQCSCPGLYQCSVTGLVFHMEREGDLVYRTVPWNRELLSQHHKQPAGPLFDIKCEQQSVCQLHLPHCEIHSTGGAQFLSVAHVNDEGMEFIGPHKITETHVVINISGFSAFGNVKDKDSPPDLVRALVLLFFRPPADPDITSLLNVLLLPKNVVLRDVLRTRKKLFGDERYIETSPQCKLHPQQEYTLSTCPEDNSVLVEPTKAEFDCDDYDNYFPSFQVNLEKIMKHIKLCLRDTNSSHSVWERRVCMSSPGVKGSCGPSVLNLPPNQRLSATRSSFIDGISGPVLKCLLDKLFEKTVITDSERESADEMPNKRDRARFVIDTVRRKGEAASSEMIEALCEVDPFLCEHLGLM